MAIYTIKISNFLYGISMINIKIMGKTYVRIVVDSVLVWELSVE